MKRQQWFSQAQQRRRFQGGMGLIEILVVVVIIAILALVLIPRLTGGKDASGKKHTAPKERAQQAAGVEYIGQINQAITMYKMDHDDQLPPNLQALKTYGVTDQMIVDPATKQPLSYDPRTGVVGNSFGKSRGIDSLGGGQTLPQIGN
jgi:prepilin-type N-terminal cleavage/methylation domain-containing protein